MTTRSIARQSEMLTQETFYPLAYRAMFFSRQLDERMLELFRKGYVKGTVASGIGNEATAVGMALPYRSGKDVVGLMHRDLASHLLMGATPYQLLCQYMANAESPTHGREGNVHHGDSAKRRLPMISHLGKMLSPVVGATWEARRQGEDVFGLAIIGDGGSSTGEFHEAINLAAVRHVPVIFLIQNNYYSFSTPVSAQFTCERLSDRAKGYNISGRTIDGTDVWEVYRTVYETLAAMRVKPSPAIIECMTLRLRGHAAYDKGDYVPREQLAQWLKQDPVPKARLRLQEICSLSETEIEATEAEVNAEIDDAVERALKVPKVNPKAQAWSAYDHSPQPRVEPFQAKNLKNGEAGNCALDRILENNPRAYLAGLDIGAYGSAFKTCKGLFERHGAERVIDMPLSEPAITGFSLGSTQLGGRPIIEFQFADFATEVATQLGMNVASWFYRSGCPAPILVRLPCGGGLTMGAFHSGEYEGLWSQFPGLKLLYPSTPQETFEALLAGFYDPNPCLVFEHKLLYWSKSGPVDFNGDLESVWRPRRYTEGDEVTVVAIGAMVDQAIAAAGLSERSIEVWNPFVLRPLELGPIMESVAKTGRLVVVQECGRSQGMGNHLISVIARECFSNLKCAPQLVAAPDVPVPFAPELELVHRPGAEKIAAAIEKIVGENA